jgi:hypothetical protein
LSTPRATSCRMRSADRRLMWRHGRGPMTCRTSARVPHAVHHTFRSVGVDAGTAPVCPHWGHVASLRPSRRCSARSVTARAPLAGVRAAIYSRRRPAVAAGQF